VSNCKKGRSTNPQNNYLFGANNRETSKKNGVTRIIWSRGISRVSTITVFSENLKKRNHVLSLAVVHNRLGTRTTSNDVSLQVLIHSTLQFHSTSRVE
jgi:hypothetical protein